MAGRVAYKEFHSPRIYRYRVGEPGFRAAWNRYRTFGRVTIGFAVVVGHYAYCLKWANARSRPA